jgi:ferredoxin-NADP reductase/ferredoxin
MDGDVLQPPLLLLSGLGEVSRIGEVILNPFLGPRLKSGVITTDMPLAHDKPIDFGLQKFCESCNKCARECPSGAITAGPKRMFNGYEIWKSDSQRCTIYRVSQQAGAMCGRCMKTCPWNLEGLFAEAPFRWLAMNMPWAAKGLAWLDDAVGRGGLNPIKKWWWDLEMVGEGPYVEAAETNVRDLQRDLKIDPEAQGLAVYPADLVPPPYFFPFHMDREKGVAAHSALLSPSVYKRRLADGETVNLAHAFKLPEGPEPVIRVEIAEVDRMTSGMSKFTFKRPDGGPLPDWEAGAHLDIAVSPEFFRQYSMSGDPANASSYEIGVLREDDGRGGSKLLHRIFQPGRRVFVSRPNNHFPLVEDAAHTLLMAGGIGVTPLIAMGHRLHALGREFALHYSVRSRAGAGYLEDLAAVPWADRVHVHVSDEGSRADLAAVVGDYGAGKHLYTCGPDAYMRSVLETAEASGWPEDALHREYFSVPEQGAWENHPFAIELVRSGRRVDVASDQSGTEALAAAGIHVDTKCSDGICGVCKLRYYAGEVEHRDFVLTGAEKVDQIMLCCSRAAEPGGVIELDL